MAVRLQPNSHAERAEILGVVDAYTARADANPAALSLIEDYLREGLEQYRGARAQYVAAEAASAALSARVDEADFEFDKAMRKLGASVDDGAGRRDSEALKSLLGGRTMSEVIKMKPTDEVRIARELLARAPLRTDLRVSEERLAAVRAATESLEAVAGPWKDAERAVNAAGLVQEAGVAALRVGWSDFMRFARRTLEAATLAELTPAYMRREIRAAEPAGGGSEAGAL